MPARLTPEQKALRTVAERQFQHQVEQIMQSYGWRFFHAPDNRPTSKGYVQNIKAGFPDLCAVRGDRLLFAELKRETGKTSAEQDAWLEALRGTGAEVYVWRPSDMASLVEVLKPEWTKHLTT